MIASETAKTIFDQLRPFFPLALLRLEAALEAVIPFDNTLAMPLVDKSHWWLCWDSRQGFYEIALDFWRHDYPPTHRTRICRLLLDTLDCPAALAALGQSVQVLRDDLELLNAPINTLSLAASSKSGNMIDGVKFYFDVHRYREYRDGSQIKSQPPAGAQHILEMVDRLAVVLGLPHVARSSHNLLHQCGLRPVLLGASFHPVDPLQRRMTIYYGLEDHNPARRDQVITLIAQHQSRPEWHELHDTIRLCGAVPISIAAYAHTHGAMDFKIDYRFMPGVNHIPPALKAVCPDMPDIMPGCLGLQMSPDGRQRVKLYFA